MFDTVLDSYTNNTSVDDDIVLCEDRDKGRRSVLSLAEGEAGLSLAMHLEWCPSKDQSFMSKLRKDADLFSGDVDK